MAAIQVDLFTRLDLPCSPSTSRRSQAGSIQHLTRIRVITHRRSITVYRSRVSTMKSLDADILSPRPVTVLPVDVRNFIPE